MKSNEVQVNVFWYHFEAGDSSFNLFSDLECMFWSIRIPIVYFTHITSTCCVNKVTKNTSQIQKYLVVDPCVLIYAHTSFCVHIHVELRMYDLQ